MKYGFDVDGVLYDFGASLREWVYLTTGRPLSSMEDPQTWDFWKDQWGLTLEEFRSHCDNAVDAEHLFRKGDPEPGTREQIERLVKDGHSVAFITARNFGTKSEENTVAWLHEHGYPYDEIHFTSDKHNVDFDWLVDDLADNYFAVAATGHQGVFLLTRPWNEHVSGVRRVSSVKDFVDTTYSLSSFRRRVDV